MIIGIPKEVKEDEYRVSLTPAGAAELIADGHTVLVEDNAGEGSGITDDQYEAVGARVTPREEVFERGEMIMKVKEPVADEYDLLREDQILYTFLHLAPAPQLTEALLRRKIVGVAYETVQLRDGSLPLLIPMSEVAGRMSVNEGAKYLERENGGRGILLGGVPGVDPGHVVIIGGGIVGTNAAKMAVGTGARVTLLVTSAMRLWYPVASRARTQLYSAPSNISRFALTSIGMICPFLVRWPVSKSREPHCLSLVQCRAQSSLRSVGSMSKMVLNSRSSRE